MKGPAKGPVKGPAKGIVLSAAASGQGKTTVTLGLLRALRDRGVDVASAKSGPDYIDPAYHAAATGRPCLTLDAWAMPPGQLRARAAAAAAEVMVVEGAMGLFDAAEDGSPQGVGSTADLAEALGLPVVLVLDISRIGQGAAAIVAGLARHRPAVRVAGVILNKAGSLRHGAMAARAVEAIAPVLGILPRESGLTTPERHLGLVQAAEREGLAGFFVAAAARVEAHCDVAALLELALPLAVCPGEAAARLAPLGQRIAVARDLAFGFAYAHLLDDWRAQGAEILPFSPLADEGPAAACDAVYLPGGYPELHGEILARAEGFKKGVTRANAQGAVVYGECGGYMVLGRRIVDASGNSHEMLNLLALETSFEKAERHLGYRKLRAGAAPWPGSLMAHEFHYSTTLRAEGRPLFQMQDAAGNDLGPTGLIDGRVMGSFAHVIGPEAG